MLKTLFNEESKKAGYPALVSLVSVLALFVGVDPVSSQAVVTQVVAVVSALDAIKYIVRGENKNNA